MSKDYMNNGNSEPLTERVHRQMTIPCDPETLAFAVGIYQEAIAGRMPSAHIPPRKGPGLHLTDAPMNRGMMAILKETRHLSEEDRQVLMFRVMHFAETVSAALLDTRLKKHLRSSDDTGLEISNELMKAYAACKFVNVNDYAVADMDHLAGMLEGVDPT